MSEGLVFPRGERILFKQSHFTTMDNPWAIGFVLGQLKRIYVLRLSMRRERVPLVDQISAPIYCGSKISNPNIWRIGHLDGAGGFLRGARHMVWNWQVMPNRFSRARVAQSSRRC